MGNSNTDFFQEFLGIFIQEITKKIIFGYEVIWRTLRRTRLYQLQLSRSYLAKVMAIPDFFKSFYSRFF
jgi:hypothetical protein